MGANFFDLPLKSAKTGDWKFSAPKFRIVRNKFSNSEHFSERLKFRESRDCPFLRHDTTLSSVYFDTPAQHEVAACAQGDEERAKNSEVDVKTRVFDVKFT